MTNDQSPRTDEQPEAGLDASAALVQTLKDVDPIEAVSPTADALTILEGELGRE